MRIYILIFLLPAFVVTASVFADNRNISQETQIVEIAEIDDDSAIEKTIKEIVFGLSNAPDVNPDANTAEAVETIETNLIEDVEASVTNEFVKTEVILPETNLIEDVEVSVTNEFVQTEVILPETNYVDTDEINYIDINPEREEHNVELEMEPENKYITDIQHPTINTVSVFKASQRGLLRGGANLTTCPGELVRGFTYEYSSKKWYIAAGTSFLSAIGGTAARAGAGLADFLTLGIYGDMDLVEGFPDYVWEGPWIYKPPRAIPTKSTSIPAVAASEPEKDILSGVRSGVIKTRAQEDEDFYKSKLPRNAY